MLVGTATADDAGVYRVSAELALIQTVDFFTPIVDDPYDFGRIAAANALSDVYAMGGLPKTAMNIVAYPYDTLGPEPLTAILAGGAAKLHEAGVVLLGGHSIEDDELKYGLSVTGYVHPGRIAANQGLQPGDGLVLTKPIGTGVINTAIKANLASAQTIVTVTESMATLNKLAAGIMANSTVSACTDITGFGLLGHLAEMLCGTGTSVTIQAGEVPLLPEAYTFASMGFVPVGAHNNRNFRENMVQFLPGFDPVMRDLLFDPQTSGGLLIGCPANECRRLVERLRDEGVSAATIIGYVNTQQDGTITVVEK